jgi:NADH-quinone oxidoreductase subunit K
MQISDVNLINGMINDPLCSSWTWLPYHNLLLLGFVIFFIGLYGIVFNLKNFLVSMLCIEMTYLGCSLIFIVNSVYFFDPEGQIYSLVLIVLAAAEAALGLGLLITVFRLEKRIDFPIFAQVKG